MTRRKNYRRGAFNTLAILLPTLFLLWVADYALSPGFSFFAIGYREEVHEVVQPVENKTEELPQAPTPGFLTPARILLVIALLLLIALSYYFFARRGL